MQPLPDSSREKKNMQQREKEYVLRKMRRADGIEDDYTIYEENEGVYLAILRGKNEDTVEREYITRKRRFLLPRYFATTGKPTLVRDKVMTTNNKGHYFSVITSKIASYNVIPRAQVDCSFNNELV